MKTKIYMVVYVVRSRRITKALLAHISVYTFADRMLKDENRGGKEGCGVEK